MNILPLTSPYPTMNYRAKTTEFKERIREHLETIDSAITNTTGRGRSLPITDMAGRMPLTS